MDMFLLLKWLEAVTEAFLFFFFPFSAHVSHISFHGLSVFSG